MQTNAITVSGVQERNDFMLSVLGRSSRMLQSKASSLGCFLGYDFDDLYQMAAVAVLEHYDKLRVVRDPVGFLGGILRLTLLVQLRDRVKALSLDMPLTEDGFTLADTLAAPDVEQVDTDRQDKRVEAVHAALKRLPLETQMYLRRVNDLNSYNPVLPVEGRYAGQRPNYNRSNQTLCMQSRSALRSDKSLVSAVCQ